MIYKDCTKCGRKLNYRNKLKGRNMCKMCARKYAKQHVIEVRERHIKKFLSENPHVKLIEGYDRYLISNTGSVYTATTRGVREMKLGPGKRGYISVTLFQNKKKKSHKVHRLVASAFIPNNYPYVKKIINHKDGIKTNNHYTNLEWCTYKQNSQHALKTGLIPVGSEKLNSKLDEKKVLEIFQQKGKKSYDKLAEEYGVSYKVISMIMKKEIWKHVKRIKPKRRLLCNRVKKVIEENNED